jgi:hypothetical protein
VEPWVAKERFEVNGTPEAMNYQIMLGNDSTLSSRRPHRHAHQLLMTATAGKSTMIGLVNRQDLTKMIGESA